jgi:dihydrofolate synthase/folylpolyglutamate synthase
MAPDNLRLKDNFSDAVNALLRFPKFGDGVGLHRMLYFADALPYAPWLRRLDAIRVTGSKGKGSVGAIAAEILFRLGIRTGLYTSPHLLRFHERIRLDGECISDADLAAPLKWVLESAARLERQSAGDRVGAFEAFTALALNYFGAHDAEAVVAEAGIGGRYDSTRVIPGRVVCLTSVELEHTELLGGTHELIAYDKVDLCPDGGRLVVGHLDAGVARRLRAYCALRQIGLTEAVEQSDISRLTYADGMMHFDLECGGVDFGHIVTPLLGEHQARNAAIAVLAAQHWLAANRPGVSTIAFRDAVAAALRRIQWPGRLQRISTSPEIVIDVGHTPHSLRTIASAIRRIYADTPLLLVTGVSADKDIRGILAELAPIASEIICTRARHKGAPVKDIAQFCEALRPETPCRTAETVGVAMDKAIERASAAGMTVVVAGGLFLAMEAFAYLRGADEKDLRFF